MKKYLYSLCVIALSVLFFTTCKDKETNVTAVTLKSTLSLAIGANEILVATVLPENADNKNITWSSDKPEFATVDQTGKVTAVAAGTAKITVTTKDGGKTATCIVTITSISVTAVSLNKPDISLVVGTNETLLATLAPANADNKNVTWSSDKPEFATVDQTGKVTAVAAGMAKIMVTSVADNTKTATCTVTVTATTVIVTGVTLKTSTSLVNGSDETLIATIAPATATNKNVTWTSSAEGIATVNNAGKVTAVAAGTATITVTTEDGGKTATCTVTVTPVKVAGVALNKQITSLVISTTETLTVAISPANADNKNVTWSSDKPEFATVDQTGKVTAVAAGTATITVTTEDGSKTATCTVTVTATSVIVTGVTLSSSTLDLTAGETSSLSASVTPANATNQNVTWSSSNTAVATVANGVVTAVAAGSAIITVTTEDGSKTATCTVTVNAAAPVNLIANGDFKDETNTSATTVAEVLGTGWYAEPADKGDASVAPWGVNQWTILPYKTFPLTCFTTDINAPLLTYFKNGLTNGEYTLSVTGKSGWEFYLTANGYNGTETIWTELASTSSWQDDKPENTGATYSVDLIIATGEITVGLKFGDGDWKKSASIKELKLVKKP